MSNVEAPTLTYYLGGRDVGFPQYDAGTRLLAAVMSVSVTIWRPTGDDVGECPGAVSVTLHGVLLRRDGTPSRHHTTSTPHKDALQPSWLLDIVSDARYRLGVDR